MNQLSVRTKGILIAMDLVEADALRNGEIPGSRCYVGGDGTVTACGTPGQRHSYTTSWGTIRASLPLQDT